MTGCDESHPYQHDAVHLRKFPYPYRCAIALSNDIDETSLDHFVQMHNFLCTKANTIYGTGLGLETGSSFWMYDVEFKHNSFCYYKGTSTTESASAPVIRELIDSGHLDTLHAYGNFSRVGGFRRALAQRALEELCKRELNVSVWVNHGDKFNTQNLGLVRRAFGDLPGSDAYHADLLRDYGMRFLDNDVITDIVGQDRPCSLLEAYLRPNGRPFASETLRKFTKAGMMSFDSIMKRAFGRDVFHKFAYNGDNSLMAAAPLQDHQPMHHFRRYGFWRNALADDIPFLLSERTLTRLRNTQGYMVVYVHLGRFRTDSRRFSEQTISAFRRLARYAESGTIWTTTASKLLKYNLAYRHLVWNTELKRDAITVYIQGLNDPVTGRRQATLEEIRGLTFYSPDADNTVVVLGGKVIKPNKNAPDDLCKIPSVSIPLARVPLAVVKE